MATKADAGLHEALPDDFMQGMQGFAPGFSVGVDIAEIARFKNLDALSQGSRARFLAKVFTKKELAYCTSRANPAPHLAARFAGKEAVLKSLTLLTPHDAAHPALSQIEITHGAKGAPIVKLPSRFNGIEVQVSLSHSRESALACAIARRRA